MRHREIAFETVIEANLLANGYVTQARDDYDAETRSEMDIRDIMSWE